MPESLPLSPTVLASHGAWHWSLALPQSPDPFGLYEVGAGTLLLLAMHLTDPRPWECARHPVVFRHSPGWIDNASKRLVGKRFQVRAEAMCVAEPTQVLQPVEQILERLHRAQHDFYQQPQGEGPQRQKQAGQLLPRALQARARCVHQGRTWDLFSRNFAEISPCLHAEVTLVLALADRLAALGSQELAPLDSFELHSTLKPCRMCAAFLHRVRGFCRSFRVSYEQDDPGRLAQRTLLDHFGYASASLPSLA